ncbi:MAG: YggS family pyridoxal phosphate-dependent enzyme [Clostridiales bacterium]|jgi:pyridoxal phosphate enzyme (YggS family)|nr:YggS family pyridoxal phosphate-dependent enzyme [Clostridiales bacterium]
MSKLRENIEAVRARLRLAADRSGQNHVQLVAVTKTVPVATIGEAIQLGLTSLGENRLQEALPKVEMYPAVDWHFIGRLQTNKVKDVVGRFNLIHSLDRWKLAEALHKQAEELDKPVSVLVQVNIAGESQKGGLPPAQLQEFLREAAALPGLRVEGLMTVPPYEEDAERVRPYFREMNRLFHSFHIPGVKMNILSMGMTHDFIVAVEEGANLVRIGSAIFGERI